MATPFSVLYNRKPHLGHLRVLGCTAYLHIPKEERPKLGAKAFRTVLLGYDDQTKAYRCYHPAKNRIVISPNVTCLEDTWGNYLSDSPSITANFFDEFLGEDVYPPDRQQELAPADARPAEIDAPAPVPQDPILDVQPEVAQPATAAADNPRRGVRLRSAPRYLVENYVGDDVQINNIETMDTVSDEISFNAAMRHPGWRASMQEELDSLIQNNTWVLEHLPSEEERRGKSRDTYLELTGDVL